jgi:hypothetical protein
MISKRAWESYPSTYRAGEMATIAGWIRAGESGSIIGLPGAGKSNLLGFLSNRPEALRQYLPPDFGNLALVHVDLNNLPNNDLATFFRVILRSLFEARKQVMAIDETLATAVESLYRKVEDKSDAFLAQSALRETLFLFQEQQVRLVLVFDPFDQFCEVASTQVLDNLRGLRDSFKANLSYLMGLRHEVTYIRNPVELGELYEIVDTHQCWLGAMEGEDARWVISQVETAAGQSFSQTQVNRLIELTGGFPALLRAASLWLVRISSTPTPDAWQKLLLAESSIRNRLDDLRHGLTGEEEAALSVLQKAWLISSTKHRHESLRQVADKYAPVLKQLELKRLCKKDKEGWQLFAGLFAEFVAGMEGISAGKIQRDVEADSFFLGDKELSGLSERDRRLLHHFMDHPRTAHTIDDLIGAAWPEDEGEGVSNEAVQQAIRHLRKQIEPNPAKPCYLITERGAGYRFFAEGAPRGK